MTRCKCLTGCAHSYGISSEDFTHPDQTDKYGRYHATNEGLCSWYEFACEIFRAAGMDVKVTPVHSDEYPAAKAKRPMNSRMSKEKLTENGFERLPEWKDAVARYLKEITW